MIVRAIVPLVIAAILFAGCGTRHISLEDQRSLTKHREVLVRRVEYTGKGLPVFSNQLHDRPSGAGERFTIAQLVDGRPATSFDIVVAGPEADFTKPFKVVYKWTGEGFQIGAKGTAVTTEMASHGTGSSNCRDEAIITLAIILTPIVVGTTGGFIIGLADGIKTTAQEVGKVMVGNYEQVVTFTTYSYDARDRLFLMRMYKADDSRQELVRTEYAYDAGSLEPVRAVITTYPDGAVKTLE